MPPVTSSIVASVAFLRIQDFATRPASEQARLREVKRAYDPDDAQSHPEHRAQGGTLHADRTEYAVLSPPFAHRQPAAAGLELEPVYTAKALAAILDGNIPGPVLFLNTHGPRPFA